MPRDIATRLRELYNAMNNPPSPGLPDGASVIIEAASAIDALKCAMIEAREALDDHLGDSDFDHFESDEERREEAPDLWASARLAAAIDNAA